MNDKKTLPEKSRNTLTVVEMTTQVTLMSLCCDMCLALDMLEARLRQFQTIGNFKMEKHKRNQQKKPTKLRNSYGYVKENTEGTLTFG